MPIALRQASSRQPLIKYMAGLVEAHQPDALWGVPRGGQDFAEEISDELELPMILLRVTGRDAEGRKTFGFASDRERKQARQYPRKVGIEDLTTELHRQTLRSNHQN